MCIRDRHTKGRKLDTLEQLEIYKHTKTNKNDILNEQTQFKPHALFEHISPCLLYTSDKMLTKKLFFISAYERNFVCICVYFSSSEARDKKQR